MDKSLFFYTIHIYLLGDIMFKNLYMSILYFFIAILLFTILITISNYFNLLSPSLISKLKIILPISAIFISSFVLGTKSSKLGYLEGIKLGVIIVLIFIIISVLAKSFLVKSLVYYLILLLTSILGAMIGINKKKK